MLATSAVINAQFPSAPAPRFDVISVKSTPPGGRGGPGPFVNTNPGRLIARRKIEMLIVDRAEKPIPD